MNPTPIDAFRGTLDGERLVLELGQSASLGEVSEAGRTIDVAARIGLGAQAAQRLVYALDEALRRSGAGPVPQQSKPDAQARAAETQRRGETPLNAPPDQAGTWAALLMQLVSGLGVPVQYERSVRFSRGHWLGNRFLLSVSKDDLGEAALEHCRAICSQLLAPPEMLAAMAEHFASAGAVHFGFEGAADSIVCKLYVERDLSAQAGQVGQAQPQTEGKAPREPLLQHIAYKWDLLSGAQAVGRYWWHPGLSEADISDRLAQIYRDTPDSASAQMAQAALQLASGKTAPGQLHYMEVQDQGSPRRSFDILLYDAQLQVADLRPMLHTMREHFGLRPGQFQALFDQIKTQRAGHLAGGVHRDGSEFFTLYYGMGSGL